MPLPKPHAGESQDDFMGRCMGSDAIQEYDSQDQRVAVCMQIFRDRNKKSAGAMATRAYSVFETKSLDDGERTLEGIATTPRLDHMGDIIESAGAKYALPIPLLWQHKHDQPVGHVEIVHTKKDGIQFRAKIATIDEPGELRDLTNKAWQSIKSKLVRGVSIGFSPIDWEPMEKGGWRIKSWTWHELSLVTIPANADATISLIKSIDYADRLAASGHQDEAGCVEPAQRVAVATRATTQKAAKSRSNMPTISEQISSFEATRAAHVARMNSLMEAAGEKGETLDQAGTDEYEGLESEVSKIDDHLVRLKRHEKLNARAAVAVDQATTEEKSTKARIGIPATAKSPKLPQGTSFTRFVIALVRARGNVMQAAEVAKMWPDTPEVSESLSFCMRAGTTDFTQIRAAVAAGNTTDGSWAGPLVNYEVMVNEFIELLRPATIIGRIPGFRRVPFNVKMPSQTSGSTVNWVGEGRVKPVGSMAFDAITLGFTKIAGIVVLTEELMRFSNPSVEAIVRQDLVNAITEFMDRDFVDPAKALSLNVSPASITNGVTPVVASGPDEADFRHDLKVLQSKFLAANLSPAGSVWIMSQQQALAFSLMVNALGQPSFPNIDMNGGTLMGIPVVASENVPATGNSPADGGLIILAKASEILMADDGNVSIDASREASLQMDSAPDSPPTASTVMVSLWQHNMVGLRAEREINWLKRNPAAVQYISSAKYE